MVTFSDDFNAGTPAGEVDASADWAQGTVASGDRITYQTGSWSSQGAVQKASSAAAGQLYGAGANLPDTADQQLTTFFALATGAGTGAAYLELRLRWDTVNDRYIGAKIYEDKVEIVRSGTVLATWTFPVTHTGWQAWARFEAVADNVRLWLEDVNFSGTPDWSRTPDLEVLDLVVSAVGNWGFKANRSGVDDWDSADLDTDPPATPSILTKTDLNSQNLVPVTLTGSSFVDPDPASYHYATRWQIDARGGDFNPPQVDDEVDTVNLTVRTFFLKGSTDFDARIAYQDQDGNWSAWSSVYELTTAAAFTPGSGTPPTLPPDVFPTLSQAPDYVFTEGYRSETLITSGDTGVERRRPKLGTPRRTITIRYNALGPTDADLLWAFFVSVNGSYKAFQFTHPLTAEVVPVRFADDTMTRDLFEYSLYKFGLTLLEVYTPDNTDILP